MPIPLYIRNRFVSYILRPSLSSPEMAWRLVTLYLEHYEGRDWRALSVASARTQASHALALALAHRYGEQNRITEIDAILQHLIETPGWDQGWTSPLPGYSMALVIWLVQHQGLPPMTRWRARERLAALADYWAEQPIRQSTPDNSSAEENAWRAGFLATCAMVFPGWDTPGRERAATWEKAARRFAFHVFTTPTDKLYGAEDASIDEEGRVVNHGMEHPQYALYSINGGAPIAYLRGAALPGEWTKPIPLEILHNIDLVWSRYHQFIGPDWVFTNPEFDQWDGHDDWGVDATFSIHALAWLAYLSHFWDANFEDAEELYYRMLVWELRNTPRSDYGVFLTDAVETAPAVRDSLGGPTPDALWLLDSIAAERHVQACLIGLPAGGGCK